MIKLLTVMRVNKMPPLVLKVNGDRIEVYEDVPSQEELFADALAKAQRIEALSGRLAQHYGVESSDIDRKKVAHHFNSIVGGAKVALNDLLTDAAAQQREEPETEAVS